MMKIKIITILLYILIINFSIAYAQTIENVVEFEEQLEQQEEQEREFVEAESAVLIDYKTGTVMYDKQKDKREYPASTTKIMTALLALEYGNLDDIVTVSHNAVYGIGPGSSHIGMKVDEELTLEQAIYGVMLMSANELSIAVAEHIDGSVEKFAQRMTSRAKELGAINTNFTNPHGLHEENHYTTAYDMALIAQEALKLDKFREIISTNAYQIPPTNKNEKINYLANQHRMFRKDSQHTYPGTIGGKTGFTNEAKYTLVTYAERDDLTLIAVVMYGETLDSRYVDTKNILDYGFDNYEYQSIFNKNNFSLFIPVSKEQNGEEIYSDKLEVYADKDVELLLEKNFSQSKLQTETLVPEVLSSSVNEGEKIGTLNLKYEGETLATIDLLAKYSIIIPQVVPENDSAKTDEIVSKFDFIPLAITITLIVGILILLLGIKIKQKRRPSIERYISNRR